MKHELNPTIDKFEGKFSFLSNFFAAKELWWLTNEHFFQAMKCKNVNDAVDIMFKSTGPNVAKRKGRKAKIREDWDDIKDYVMLIGLWIKFEETDLRDKLLATGEAELIEGNYWHDNYWGNCSCSKCENIEGQNKLGKLLMIVRDIYQTIADIEEENNK
jgi:ribA/ribD-fused uncharacterized protein